jgi:hypothetical protein
LRVCVIELYSYVECLESKIVKEGGLVCLYLD